MAGLITIVGGGLAGLSAGIALRRVEVPVEIHEAGAYPRHRVCGEFLCGVSEADLAGLGLEGRLADASQPRTMAWFLRGRQLLRARLPGPARGISRFALDARMQEEFLRLGGTLHTRSRIAAKGQQGLLWCAGRARMNGPWVGIKAHFSGISLEADLEMHLGDGGYLGLCRVEDGSVNACGLFRAECVREGGGSVLLRAARKTFGASVAERLGGGGCLPGSLVVIAGFRTGWQPASQMMPARAGDAMAMIPPYAGNGMSMAMESGVLAARALADFAVAKKSWPQACRSLDRVLHRRFRKRMFVAEALHPFLTCRAGQALLAVCASAGLLPLRSIFASLR